MKISERISSAIKQVKTHAKQELSLVGKSFGVSARAVENPGLNRVEVKAEPLAVLKKAKGETHVIANMSIDFARDDHEVRENGKLSEYVVHSAFDDVRMKHPERSSVAKFSCRHMIVEELVRREGEIKHPNKHTKADRAKIFDVKFAPHIATQRQHLESRLYNLTLYTNNAHIFSGADMGQFLESEFGKLEVGSVKNFALLSSVHAMTLTIKHTKEGYSVSIWDPNFTADHVKMKFDAPSQAAKTTVEKLLGKENTAVYTQSNPMFTAYELPKGWVGGTPLRSREVKIHNYEGGSYSSTMANRTEWVKKLSG